MIKKISLIILCLILYGCCSFREEKVFTGVFDGGQIGRNPFQWIGGWTVDEQLFVKEIIINKAWVNEIKQDKYHYRIEMRTPSTSIKKKQGGQK